MKLVHESNLDRSLAIDNNLPGPSNSDIACVLLNYVKQTKNNMILNEFMRTTGKTASLVRQISEAPIHLHDLFDQHPLANKMFEQTKRDLNSFDNIEYHRTSPLDVDMDALEKNKPYDLIYTLLPYKMPQAPNTIETVISKTLELWTFASSDGTIIMGPDYDKPSVRRQVDMFVKSRKYEMETYLDTNYNKDNKEPDPYMFAFQVRKDG